MPIIYPSGAAVTITVAGADVSSRVLDISGQHGKTGPFERVAASTVTITLDDTADTFAHSTSLPLLAPVTVDCKFASVSRRIFTGSVLRRREPVKAPGSTQIVLECADGFEFLARVNLRLAAGTAPVGDQERVDQRIARWLDAAGWTAARSLETATGWTCPGVVLQGNVLTEIMRTAMAEGGDFYIDGDGTASYRLWTWRLSPRSMTVQGSFSDRLAFDWVPYTQAELVDDLESIANRVNGIRRDPGTATPPNMQSADDPTSISKWGLRIVSFDALELFSDPQVATRVAAVRDVYSNPTQRWDNITVYPEVHPIQMWNRVIPLRFGDLVLTNRTWRNGNHKEGYGHIIGGKWQFTPKMARFTYLTEATSNWDRLRPPVAPLTVIFDPTTGNLRAPDGFPCEPDGTTAVVLKDANGNVLKTFPPDALCGAGIPASEIPPGTTQVCWRNAHGDQCFNITPQSSKAILWLDVDDLSRGLIERIDQDLVPLGPAVTNVRLDAWGGASAIDTLTGGVVAIGDSQHMRDAASAPTQGWNIDFYLEIDHELTSGDDEVNLIDLGTLMVFLSPNFTSAPGPATTWLGVTSFNDTPPGNHISGPLCPITAGVVHHIIIDWNPKDVGTELGVVLDGVEFDIP